MPNFSLVFQTETVDVYECDTSTRVYLVARKETEGGWLSKETANVYMWDGDSFPKLNDSIFPNPLWRKEAEFKFDMTKTGVDWVDYERKSRETIQSLETDIEFDMCMMDDWDDVEDF